MIQILPKHFQNNTIRENLSQFVVKTRVNLSFGKRYGNIRSRVKRGGQTMLNRYAGFDASSAGMVNIGCKSVRQMNLQGGLYLWTHKVSKIPALKLNSVKSVYSVAKKLVSIRASSWRKTIVSTIVEITLQKNFFLQNKAKLTQLGQFGKFSPAFLHQKSTPNFTRQKNEPNSNPNEPNFLASLLTIFDLLAMMDKPKLGNQDLSQTRLK